MWLLLLSTIFFHFTIVIWALPPPCGKGIQTMEVARQQSGIVAAGNAFEHCYVCLPDKYDQSSKDLFKSNTKPAFYFVYKGKHHSYCPSTTNLNGHDYLDPEVNRFNFILRKFAPFKKRDHGALGRWKNRKLTPVNNMKADMIETQVFYWTHEEVIEANGKPRVYKFDGDPKQYNTLAIQHWMPPFTCCLCWR